MNTFTPSVLTRSRRRLVIFLIAIAITALALAGILGGTSARGASIYASIPSLGVIERYDAITGADLGAFATHLSTPGGMVFDRTGNLYVNETGNATIRKIAPDGTASVFYAGGAIKGSNALAIDANGTIYIANYVTNSVLRITTAGFLETFAKGGGLSIASGMAFDSSGNLFVTNTNDGKLPRTISKITPNGVSSVYFNSLKLLDGPTGIAIDRDDSLVIVDKNLRRVSRITPTGILSFTLSDDRLNQATGLLLGAGGDVLINSQGRIYRRNAAGIMEVFASPPSRTTNITAFTLGPNPIPEPTTLSLCLIGLSGCWLNARRGASR